MVAFFARGFGGFGRWRVEGLLAWWLVWLGGPGSSHGCQRDAGQQDDGGGGGPGGSASGCVAEGEPARGGIPAGAQPGAGGEPSAGEAERQGEGGREGRVQGHLVRAGLSVGYAGGNRQAGGFRGRDAGSSRYGA